MKLVVTDGYTLNPGDLSWEGIEKFGELVVYDRTTEAQLFGRCAEAEIILTNKVPISDKIINAVPGLKLLAVTATGFNIVDVEAAGKRGITVCNVPDYGTASVAQHTFALILELANRVGINSNSVAQGEWRRSRDFCYTKASLTELSGKTLGIIGYGKIGEQVAAIADAFQMKVIYYSRTKKENTKARFVDLNTLMSVSDIISLHCPLTKDNKEFINRELLGYTKPTAWIINTSRGQLIQEKDLAEALDDDRLAGAALDVLSVEPPSSGNPLLETKNCIITPHTAWMSYEARSRILKITEENIAGFIKGSPQNVVAA